MTGRSSGEGREEEEERSSDGDLTIVGKVLSIFAALSNEWRQKKERMMNKTITFQHSLGGA